MINKDYITKTFCENKAKPKLKCNGKCHLRKQLKEQDKQEGQSKNNIKEINEIQLFLEDDQLKLDPPFIANGPANLQYLQKPLFQVSHKFFHPPTC